MPDESTAVTVQVLTSINDVTPERWDACAGADNPFLSHGFLSALEDSGSATRESGWMPQHLAIEDEAGGLLACTPLYLKNHSYGEYVFDWGWADAYERAGGRYYPKLQCAVPFTPVTGPRLLVRDDIAGEQRAGLQRALAGGMIQLALKVGVSSVHITFPDEDEWQLLGENGFLKRVGQQFHWENRGYADFKSFLDDLSSRKRKNIRKERERVAESGLSIRALEGDEITDAHWDAFYQFYLDTTDKKWGQSYLHREFFSLMGERCRDAVVLISVERDGRLVAGALNLKGGDTLFGRNWGCVEDYKFLHFEACYYQAIDYAIAKGLKWVEAGAQGAHKVQRGYLPRQTYSAHWIRDPGFRDAVEDFLDRETRGVEAEMRYIGEGSPFKKGD